MREHAFVHSALVLCRKNHQRALESIQTSLESESKSKHQLLQLKKKLETEIHEKASFLFFSYLSGRLQELALDMLNKSNVEAQKTLKKLVSQIQELQGTVEEEARLREEFRENYLIADKKLQVVLAEKDELAIQREALDQQKSKLDSDGDLFTVLFPFIPRL